MMLRRLLAYAALVGGVYLLTDEPGWALLVAGLLLLLDRQLDKIPAGVRGGLQAVRESPRRGFAGASMGAGLIAVPAGVALSATGGAALIVVGALLVVLALITGWNA